MTPEHGAKKDNNGQVLGTIAGSCRRFPDDVHRHNSGRSSTSLSGRYDAFLPAGCIVLPWRWRI